MALKSLTNAQQETLQQFKKNISDILAPHDTDAVLVKWLKARNYNAKKAELYFREAYAVRQVYQLDTIIDTYTKPEVADKYDYTSFLGFAKDGSIVRYNAIGRGDAFGFVMSLSTYKCSMYCSYVLETDLNLQRKENLRTGREINEITYIFDLEGFSIPEFMHKNVIEMALDLSHIVQDYYPEVWGNLFVINVPPYFDTIFNLLKPILRLGVVQKLQIISKESVAETLLKYIDEDVLPEFLGGKRVDSSGDPQCREFLRFGGKVPKLHYLSGRPLLAPSDPGVCGAWVGPRAAHNHSVVARTPGSVIRIEFRTENGSIHLKMLYRKMDDEGEASVPAVDEYLSECDPAHDVVCVSPGMRIQSHVAPVDETCIAPWPGTYIFRFDNSYSWFGSRRLIYRIRIIEPDSDFVVVP